MPSFLPFPVTAHNHGWAQDWLPQAGGIDIGLHDMFRDHKLSLADCVTTRGGFLSGEATIDLGWVWLGWQHAQEQGHDKMTSEECISEASNIPK